MIILRKISSSKGANWSCNKLNCFHSNVESSQLEVLIVNHKLKVLIDEFRKQKTHKNSSSARPSHPASHLCSFNRNDFIINHRTINMLICEPNVYGFTIFWMFTQHRPQSSMVCLREGIRNYFHACLSINAIKTLFATIFHFRFATKARFVWLIVLDSLPHCVPSSASNSALELMFSRVVHYITFSPRRDEITMCEASWKRQNNGAKGNAIEVRDGRWLTHCKHVATASTNQSDDGREKEIIGRHRHLISIAKRN